jgi:GNAT superfamily N-acetyltransferase
MERGMPERFKMTTELMDQVIFGMENQRENLILDARTGLVVPRELLTTDEAGEEERYFDLPDWTPSDGFRLMEGFAGALKNPIYRERLRQILNSGRGVFRGFKNVLKERPDLEKKWFLYKERLMKQKVREWYAALCGYWDAEEEGAEPPDTEDLFLEEFSIQDASGDDPDVQRCRQEFFEEIYGTYPEELRGILVRQYNWRSRPFDFALKAISPGGGVCGILGGFIESGSSRSFLFLDCVYILPEFRGAGIAAGLIDQASKRCYEEGFSNLFFTIPPEGAVLSDNLKRRGFKQFRTTMELDIRNWYYETVQPV